MEKSSKRGKIPQSDWPLIMARYEAGETLASIARTYDCSPPAISYVVSRSRAKHDDRNRSPRPAGMSEPQLVKAVGSEGPGTGDDTGAAPSPLAADATGRAAANGFAANGSRAPESEVRPEFAPSNGNNRNPSDARREPNGFGENGVAGRSAASPAVSEGAAPGMEQRPAATAPAPANGPDQRRTLHLSLGNAAVPGSGNLYATEPQPMVRGAAAGRGPADIPPGARGQAGASGLSEIRQASFDRAGPHTEDADALRKSRGSFIGQELRARVDSDISAFLAAFDAALVQDTQENRSALREATDRLLRAGARTRIELERLEARMPLPPRDGSGRSNEPNRWYR
jgi:hypothetical protein